MNAIESVMNAASGGRVFQAQLRPALNRADHIIEIVGDAAGKVSNRFELLKRGDLHFERFSLGDVLNDPLNFRRAGEGSRHCATAKPYRDVLAVFSLPLGLPVFRAPF